MAQADALHERVMAEQDKADAWHERVMAEQGRADPFQAEASVMEEIASAIAKEVVKVMALPALKRLYFMQIQGPGQPDPMIPHFYQRGPPQPDPSLLSTGPRPARPPDPSLLSTEPSRPNPSLLLANLSFRLAGALTSISQVQGPHEKTAQQPPRWRRRRPEALAIAPAGTCEHYRSVHMQKKCCLCQHAVILYLAA